MLKFPKCSQSSFLRHHCSGLPCIIQSFDVFLCQISHWLVGIHWQEMAVLKQKMTIVVSVGFGFYNKIASSEQLVYAVYFSQFWRLGSEFLVRAHFLVHGWCSLAVSSCGSRGTLAPLWLFYNILLRWTFLHDLIIQRLPPRNLTTQGLSLNMNFGNTKIFRTQQ